MINLFLLSALLLYIVALLIGFSVKKGEKDSLNKSYKKNRKFLYELIWLIFFFSICMFVILVQMVPWMWIVLGINLLFIFYFYSKSYFETRCWKQHRMVIYNFLLIVVIYFASVATGIHMLNLFDIVIYFYTIYEFQYAKFKLSQPLIWD